MNRLNQFKSIILAKAFVTCVLCYVRTKEYPVDRSVVDLTLLDGRGRNTNIVSLMISIHTNGTKPLKLCSL